MVQLFGIRHHGPGSAQSLQVALEAFEPDIILVENPPDADALLHYITHTDLKPPVALLVHNAKDVRQASYFPFTAFSPEWIAFKYAFAKKIPVKGMDLPMELKFSLGPDDDDVLTEQQAEHLAQENPEILALIGDPMSYMAKLAGYTDSERWWESVFEQKTGGSDVFEATLTLMRTLREGLNLPESPETLRREAYMRQTIRKAEAEMYERIAVVCGAWHSPVLADYKSFKIKTDEALVKIKKTKVDVTWVPWSYERIAVSSGYGAGVVSPAWYALLFKDRPNAVMNWMSQVAHLFRAVDISASTAHIIEGVRLAETLAALRGRSLAGIDDMREAAITIFTGGYESPMKLIEDKLIIGDDFGEVPSEIPTIPLQRDFEARCKTLRLKLSEKKELELDLRDPPHLDKSCFLHQLNILGINWGTIKRGSYGKKGTFHEYWSLDWKPDFAIRIIEAGLWGNTVQEAAANALTQKALEATTLADISSLMELALNANLGTIIPKLANRLRDLAALTTDVSQMMNALPVLANISRYGDVRGTDQTAVADILTQLVPRLCIALPSACNNLSEEAADLFFNQILKTHRAIALLSDSTHTDDWNNALTRLADFNGTSNGTHPKIAGISNRLLFDRQLMSIQEAADRVSFALSACKTEYMAAANYLEGFLHGSGQILLYQASLWNILDEWVDQLPSESFKELMPLLRRTFSRFQKPEKEKMMEQARKGKILEQDNTQAQRDQIYDTERQAKVKPLLKLLLQTQ